MLLKIVNLRAGEPRKEIVVECSRYEREEWFYNSVREAEGVLANWVEYWVPFELAHRGLEDGQGSVAPNSALCVLHTWSAADRSDTIIIEEACVYVMVGGETVDKFCV